MKDFFKSVKFKVIAGILVVLAGFMIYAGTVQGFDTLPSQIIGFFVTPFQEISTAVTNSTDNFLGKLFNYDKVAAENAQLKQELENARSKMIDYDAAKRQNDQYKDFLGLKEENPDMVFEEASVVERDPNSQFYAFKIDKGSLHGVEYRDVVITSAGVVGVVSKVGYTYSQVQTILDPAVNIGCVDSRTGDTGMLAGTLKLASEGSCRLSYIDRTSGISAGDTVITSGSERYPKQLMIGTVREVLPEENGSSFYAVITPAEDIKAVKSVFVIKSFFGQAPQDQNGE